MKSPIEVLKNTKLSKKEKFFLTFLGLLAIYIFFSQILSTLFFRPTFNPPSPTTTITIENHTYHVLTASTPQQREHGLMYVRKPVNFDGMQFIFPNSDKQSFWNQNTHVDLKLYWMQGDTVISTADLPSIDHAGLVAVSSPKSVNKVVEIIK